MTRTSFRTKAFWPWFICGIGALFYCYEYFLRITPSLMTRELMSAYSLDGGQVGNLSAFYYHAYVPMQLMVGVLMDRYGPKRLLTLAALCCASGTYLFAGNFGLGVAQIGRMLVGFGSAFAFVGALKLVTIWFPPNRFALVSGVILCLGMIGAMIGDVLLRSMIDSLGWQDTIYISALIGILLSGAIYFIIGDTNPEINNQYAQEISFKKALYGLGLSLKNPQLWINATVGFLLYVSLSGFAEFWGIPYLEQAHHLSKTDTAYANSMIFLGWAIGGPMWGWLSDTFRCRVMPIRCASIAALVFALTLLYVPHLSLIPIFFLLFFFGLLSSAQILIFAICHEASQRKMAGTVIALTNMVVMAGGSIFQPIIGLLLDSQWTGLMHGGGRLYSIHAYHLALSVIPMAIGVAIFLTFFIKETFCTVQDKSPRNLKSL